MPSGGLRSGVGGMVDGTGVFRFVSFDTVPGTATVVDTRPVASELIVVRRVVCQAMSDCPDSTAEAIAMLRNLTFEPLVCLLVALIVVAGCGPTPTGTGPSEMRGVTIDPKTLPELGAHIGPLDDGRVEVAPPADWHVPPRNSKFVIRFQEEVDNTYPTVLIKAEDFRGGPDLSEKNIVDYARQIREQLKTQTTSNAWETVRPIKIGSLIGVTYQRMGKAKSGFKEIVLERLIVETIHNKRKYDIELRTRTGTMEEYQPYLYAIAAGMKFLDGQAPATLAPAEEQPAEEQPAAEEPAEGAAEEAAEEKPAEG